MRLLSLCLIFTLMLIAGCGGGDSEPAPIIPPTDPPPTGGGGGAAVQEPVPVSVTAGRATVGVDITVVRAAGSPKPNAESLGVTVVGEGGSASNTGSFVQRGSTRRVIVFGEGLTAGMQVTIGGPADIAIRNVRGITSTTGKPGVSFEIDVAGNAALGARSVIFRADNDDITTFTGGLEVVP